jgi:hypothetical protein|tara:strand:+ start:2028 stop:2216 length:189 start_codon:yes stop_codon:yes gene_type:complete
MMDLIEVHKETIDFLIESDGMDYDEEGNKSFYMNGVLHMESNKEGVYIRQFTNIIIQENEIS